VFVEGGKNKYFIQSESKVRILNNTVQRIRINSKFIILSHLLQNLFPTNVHVLIAIYILEKEMKHRCDCVIPSMCGTVNPLIYEAYCKECVSFL
jgi:hypothetical protein